jgi:hypothetical protein
VDHPPQLRRSAGARAAGQRGGDVVWRDAVANSRLVARAGELVYGQHGGEVHERARHRGDRDGAPDRRIAGIDGPPRAVGHDPVDRPLRRRGHLGLRRRPPDQAEVVRRRPHGEQRPVAARAHSGEVGGLDAGRHVPEAIHAGVDPQQGPVLEPVAELRAGHSGGQGLAARDHAVLPRGDLPEDPRLRPIQVLHSNT